MSSPARKILSSRHVNHDVVPTQPKAPRSAFMCFTDTKKKEMLAKASVQKNDPVILKTVAQYWRALTDRDRAYWDEEARNDKVRFVKEKAEYTGPWEQKKRRAKKDPRAPKRSMSAFLKYSQTRRAVVKRGNPDMSNTDVSRLLGEMWRNASSVERKPYKDQEKRERDDYKVRIQLWREERARVDSASRTSHCKVQTMATNAYPYPVQQQQQQQQNQHDSFLLEQSNAAMDPVRIQSVEDAATRADQRMFRSYNGPYQQPHQQHQQRYMVRKDSSFDFGIPESTIRSRHEFPEPESIPRRPRPTEEDQYHRSPYFQDSGHSFNFYQFP